MRNSNIFFNLLFVIGMLGLMYSLVFGEKVAGESRLLMDTVVTIKAWGPRGKLAMRAGFEVFENVENQLSFHLEDSQLARLNKNKEIIAGEHLLNVLKLAQKYHEKTQGYFDPTFAVLNRLYGFYTEPPEKVPSPDLLKETIDKYTGLLTQVSIKEKEVRLNQGAELDLGGIAGGYAVRLAAEAMLQQGCDVFMIDHAGDIMVQGQKPQKKPWVVGVFNPISKETFAKVELVGSKCISTSGNYQRFVRIDGQDYGHIMDPHQGVPAGDFVSVSVVADTPEEADIYSTGIFAMPPKMAMELADSLSLPALFITSGGKVVLSKQGKFYYKMLE